MNTTTRGWIVSALCALVAGCDGGGGAGPGPAPGPGDGKPVVGKPGAGGGPGQKPDPAPATCAVSADLDAFITTRMEESRIPGLAAGIVTAGGLAWAKGYGLADIAAGRAAEPDTIFALMSIGKVATATGVMQLVEKGQLDLDANINDYLTAFDIVHPSFPDVPITLRQLLTHTSGLAGDDYGVLQLNIAASDAAVQPLGEMLSDLLVPGGSRYDGGSNFSDKAPGTDWAYSSIGISLAGFVAESVAGESFDVLTAASIFAPLGMSDTSWRLDPYQNKLDRLAVMYNWDETARTHDVVAPFTFSDYPAGSIRSSVTEWSRFLAAMVDDGSFAGASIVSAATAAGMREVQFPELSSMQAIGWHRTASTRNLLGHGGDDAGASTDMWYDLDTGKGVIMLMNVTRRPDTNAILDRLLDESDRCQ
jgi:CubicO group peptidase (beta-lactamase class C family)